MRFPMQFLSKVDLIHESGSSSKVLLYTAVRLFPLSSEGASLWWIRFPLACQGRSESLLWARLGHSLSQSVRDRSPLAKTSCSQIDFLSGCKDSLE